MTPRSPKRSPSLGLTLSLLAACGGGQKPQNDATNLRPKPGDEDSRNAQTRTPTRRGPTVDLSAVTKPAAIVGELRVASPMQFAQQVDRLLGRTLAAPFASETWNHLFGDNSDRVLDPNEAVDLAIVSVAAGQDPAVVISIPTKSAEEVEAAFGQKYRFTTRADGTRTIVAVNADGDPNAREKLDTCVLSPAPRPGTGRLVCSSSSSAATRDLVAPYLVRTLSRTAVPQNQLTLSLDLNALRTSQGDAMLRELDSNRAQGLQGLADITDPVTRQSLTTVYNKVFDGLHAVVADSTTFTINVDMTDARALLSLAGEGSAANSTLLRAFASSFQGTLTPAAAQLNHLLPDAFSYFAGSIDGRPLDPTMAEIIQAVDSASVAANVPAADRTAMSSALAALRVLDQSAVSGQFGYDTNGKPWYAVTTHTASRPGAEYLTAARNVINALKRPYFQTKLRDLVHTGHTDWDPASVRELHGAGIPATAFAFQFALPRDGSTPAPTTPAPRGGHAVAPAHPAAQIIQVVMVADGNDIHVVAGANAAQVLQRYQANATAGVETTSLVQQGWGMSDLIVLAGLPNLVRATPDSNAANMARAFQTAVDGLADHGRTPIAIRLGSTDSGSTTKVGFSLEVPGAAARGIVALVDAAVNSANQPSQQTSTTRHP